MAKNSDTQPPRPAMAEPDDPLAAFKDGLRPYFPSKETLLHEGRKARTARAQRANAGKALITLAMAVGALWYVNPVWETTTLSTRVGERTRWTMRDGSEIQLNTATTAIVENRLRSRQLRLESGEARFTVAHGWRTFTVIAGDTEVRDIGTVFNVRHDTAATIVGVLEGAVEVKVSGAASGTVLTAGQGITVRDGQPGAIGAVDTDSLAWSDGKLVLDATPLRAMVAELQRYRRAPIRLRDAQAGAMRVSGDYRLDNMETLIDALPFMLPVTVVRRADGTVEIASR